MANAVVQYAESLADAGARIVIEHAESVTGQGIKGTSDGKAYYVGNSRLLAEHHIRIADELQKTGGCLCVRSQNRLYGLPDAEVALGYFAIADRIKPTSKAAVETCNAKAYR